MAPAYLLIDTNLLYRLVPADGMSDYLQQLIFSARLNELILICPDTIFNEWQEHKKDKARVINTELRDLKKEYRRQRAIDHPNIDFTEELLEDLRQKLFSQFDLVDELFERYSIRIAPDEYVRKQIDTWRADLKAPFHKPGKNNLKDAEIVHYAATCLKKAGIKKLYFAADNPKDFSQSGQEPDTLHKDLKELFAEIEVHYHRDLGPIIQLLYKAGYQKRNRASSRERRKIKNVISVDESKPILHQVEEYLDNRFGEMVIIPKEIFNEHYPFIIQEIFHYSHKPFTLITDNKEVYQLFSELVIIEGVVTKDPNNVIKTDADLARALKIIKVLSANLVEKIAFTWEKETAIQWSEKVYECDCTLCLCNHLKYQQLFEKLQLPIKSDDVRARMRQAYAHYQIGDFTRAADLFEMILRDRSGPPDIIQYLINFNLHHLGIMIRRNYWDNPVLQKRGDALIEIDLETEYNHCKSPENWQLLKWIHEKRFYKDSLFRLLEAKDKITDFYYGKNGGSNDIILQVHGQYLFAEQFLVHNSLVYDSFKEFSDLTNMYTESLLASYGSSPNLSGKQSNFSDEMVMRLVNKSNAEDLQKYLKRYQARTLKYYEPTPERKFPKSMLDFLGHYREALAGHESFTTDKSSFFRDNMHAKIYNALSLFAVLEIEPVVLNEFTVKICEVIHSDDGLHPLFLPSHLRFFITRVWGKLSEETLRSLIGVSINTEMLHDDLWFEALADAVKKKGGSFTLEPGAFEDVIQNFIGPCRHCKREHDWNILNDLFSMSSSQEQKNYISSELEKMLKENLLLILRKEH